MRACLLLALLPASLMASSHLIYLGTYTKTGPARGIYTVRLDGDQGTLSKPELAAEAVDPAWVVLTPDRRFLYTIHGSTAQARGFAVDASTGALRPLPEPAAPSANPPSHLAIDATGRVLLAANYREGYVAAAAIGPDGSLGSPQVIRHEGRGPNPERQEKPHVHSVTLSPDNRHVLVADLGLDRVFTYALDTVHARLTPGPVASASVPAGAGPRHAKFSADGRHLHVVNEMGGSVTTFAYDPARGALTPGQTVPTLPADYTGLKWNAEIRVHPNGRFVYASNRAHDSLAVFATTAGSGELSLVEIVPAGGKTPRNFALSPDGKWLVCAYQDAPLLTVFAVDPATGRLRPHGRPVEAPPSVCVLFRD